MTYGRGGIVGLLTPQANPTVEAEMAILLPADVVRVVARLRSRADRPEARLRAYLEDVERTLDDFDSLAPAVVGFACTASSYLVPEDRQAAIVARAADAGRTLITAAAAIGCELAATGFRRIGIVSPYPAALGQAALHYWRGRGFDVQLVADLQPAAADSRMIYTLTAAHARAAIARLDGLSVDALLITGTGMPVLPLLADPPPGAPPIVASNPALARALMRALGRPLPDWHEALARATGDPR